MNPETKTRFDGKEEDLAQDLEKQFKSQKKWGKSDIAFENVGNSETSILGFWK